MKPSKTKKEKVVKGSGVKAKLLIETHVLNRGITKLTEVAQWRLSDEYKLISFGYPEKSTKGKNAKKTATTGDIADIVLNGHELPPCTNAGVKYYGDILVFKINDKYPFDFYM